MNIISMILYKSINFFYLELKLVNLYHSKMFKIRVLSSYIDYFIIEN